VNNSVEIDPPSINTILGPEVVHRLRPIDFNLSTSFHYATSPTQRHSRWLNE